MTSANNLNLGKTDRVRQIKIRNLEQQVQKMQKDDYPCKQWTDEAREWYPGEKEQIIEELQKTIEILGR
jgi:hypothetical protein